MVGASQVLELSEHRVLLRRTVQVVGVGEQGRDALASSSDPVLLHRKVGVKISENLPQLATVRLGQRIADLIEVQPEFDQPPHAQQQDRVAHLIAAIAVARPIRLRQQANTVVVADCARRHAGQPSELADS